jgi:hypothetical protein
VRLLWRLSQNLICLTCRSQATLSRRFWSESRLKTLLNLRRHRVLLSLWHHRLTGRRLL